MVVISNKIGGQEKPGYAIVYNMKIQDVNGKNN
jgi:hypothetical protein